MSFTTLYSPNKFIQTVLVYDNGENDVEIIGSIYTSLMTVEKISNILNIELISLDEVEDDIFMFAIKSQETKMLVMKLIDEEGYEISAHRNINVNTGNNYNALDVSTLKDGSYKFILEDETGRSIEKKVQLTSK